MSRRVFGTERKTGKYSNIHWKSLFSYIYIFLFVKSIFEDGPTKTTQSFTTWSTKRWKSNTSGFFFLKNTRLSRICKLLFDWNMVAVTERKFEKRWKGFGQKHVLGVPMSPLASKRSSHKRQHTSFRGISSPEKANVSLKASVFPGTKSWSYGALGNSGPKTTRFHRVLAST